MRANPESEEEPPKARSKENSGINSFPLEQRYKVRVVLAARKKGPQVEGDGCDRTEHTERIKSSMRIYGVQWEGRKDILSQYFFFSSGIFLYLKYFLDETVEQVAREKLCKPHTQKCELQQMAAFHPVNQ